MDANQEFGLGLNNMRLTIEQRLLALERDNVVLHDTIKVLHKLLKEQRELITDFIVRKAVFAKEKAGDKAVNGWPDKELYTFVCKKRFDRMEKDIKKTLKLMENLRSRLKAG